MKLSYLKNSFKLFLFLISVSAFSQHELKNKVVDFVNLLPIENASVYVQNTTIGTVTNADGKFVLLVPEEMAKDTLVISSIGFKSYKVPVEEFDNSFEVFLEEDVATLEEVVLNATPRPKTGDSVDRFVILVN